MAAILTLITPAACEGETPAERAAYAEARADMVRVQLSGEGREIRNERVLRAMGSVPRHEFVPVHLRAEAYEDHPLPIGHGQTISQPYIVALMTEVLDPQPGERILEIGTGSGYQAAVLAALGVQVHTIEIVEALGEQAKRDLERLHYDNVKVRIGDGYAGWPEAAQFDAVIVTCAPEKVPQPLVDQLKPGGRMIIPVGVLGSQQLILLEKKADGLRQTDVLPVRFVPMTGEAEKKGKDKK